MNSNNKPPQFPSLTQEPISEEPTPPHGHNVRALSSPHHQAYQPGQQANPYQQAPSQPFQQGAGNAYQQGPSQPYQQAPSQPYQQPPSQPYQQGPSRPFGPTGQPPAGFGQPVQPGFGAPVQNQNQFNAPAQGFGSQTSPGFVSPGYVPEGTGQFNTGQFNTGQFAGQANAPHQTGSFGAIGHTPAPNLTGGFNAVGHPPADGLNAGVSASNMTGTFSAIHLQQGAQALNNAPKTVTSDKRVTYGIWGAAGGAMLGMILGILNALLEDVPMANAQQALYGIIIIGMLVCGGLCAYAPSPIEALLRKHGLIGPDAT